MYQNATIRGYYNEQAFIRNLEIVSCQMPFSNNLGSNLQHKGHKIMGLATESQPWYRADSETYSYELTERQNELKGSF